LVSKRFFFLPAQTGKYFFQLNKVVVPNKKNL